MFNKVLVTGAAGFIGSHLAEELVSRQFAKKYIFLDAGKIGSDIAFIRDFVSKHPETCEFFKLDLAYEKTYSLLTMAGHEDIDAIFHLAAESHVDRSIRNGVPFGMSNIMGTLRLLEYTKELYSLKIFLNFSTDEVMGQRKHGAKSFKTKDRKTVRNVYSATKSAQEELGFGYSITHGVRVITTRCTNVYGPRQAKEKFLPTIITNALLDQEIPVYGHGLQEREWIFVEDVASITASLVAVCVATGIDSDLSHENIYHIGSMHSIPNIEFARMVLSMMGKSEDLLDYVDDRLGHDFRYDLDCSSTHGLGLVPKTNLEDGLKKTIDWFSAQIKEEK